MYILILYIYEFKEKIPYEREPLMLGSKSINILDSLQTYAH